MVGEKERRRERMKGRKGTQKENMTYLSSNRRMERIISDSQTQTGVKTLQIKIIK